MLVVTVKKGESVHIGEDIHITLVEASSTGRIRLGITAPRDLSILRDVHLAKIAADAVAQSYVEFDRAETVGTEIEILINSIVEDPAHVTG